MTTESGWGESSGSFENDYELDSSGSWYLTDNSASGSEDGFHRPSILMTW